MNLHYVKLAFNSHAILMSFFAFGHLECKYLCFSCPGTIWLLLGHIVHDLVLTIESTFFLLFDYAYSQLRLF